MLEVTDGRTDSTTGSMTKIGICQNLAEALKLPNGRRSSGDKKAAQLTGGSDCGAPLIRADKAVDTCTAEICSGPAINLPQPVLYSFNCSINKFKSPAVMTQLYTVIHPRKKLCPRMISLVIKITNDLLRSYNMKRLLVPII